MALGGQVTIENELTIRYLVILQSFTSAINHDQILIHQQEPGIWEAMSQGGGKNSKIAPDQYYRFTYV
jgi:hypothetical protein